MKKLLLIVCSLALIFGMAGGAGALTFTLDSYDVTLNDSDPGLALYWNPILSTPASGDFAVGDSVSFELFQLGTDENSITLFEDTDWYDIVVDFVFSAPAGVIADDVNGHTRGRLAFDDGVVRWFGPATFTFGIGGEFTIELADASFGTPGSVNIVATMTYVTAPDDDPGTNPVPEPATMLLLGFGLLGIGLARRKS